MFRPPRPHAGLGQASAPARSCTYLFSLLSKGQEAEQEVAMTKLYLSECFVQSSLEAIQIHGGYGYSTEFEIERELRDAVGGTIYTGTSEIQREIIAPSMGL